MALTGTQGSPSASLRSIRVEPRDLLAGVSVAVVLVPQSLAYAQLAGMPAYRGLFAASIPPLVAAPFASSPYLQPGPTAVSALLTYGALTPLAPLGSARYIELGLLLALLVGAIRVLVGLLHAGVIAYLMSQSLLTGFIPAAAILIVASQLPVALGTHGKGKNELYSAGWAVGHTGGWRADAVVVAVLASIVLLLGRRLHPLFPGVLLAVVAAILYGKFGGYGGPKLGPVHASFPPLTTSLPWRSLPHLVVPALVIALLGFAEAASIARTYAALDRQALGRRPRVHLAGRREPRGRDVRRLPGRRIVLTQRAQPARGRPDERERAGHGPHRPGGDPAGLSAHPAAPGRARRDRDRRRRAADPARPNRGDRPARRGRS